MVVSPKAAKKKDPPRKIQHRNALQTTPIVHVHHACLQRMCVRRHAIGGSLQMYQAKVLLACVSVRSHIISAAQNGSFWRET